MESLNKNYFENNLISNTFKLNYISSLIFLLSGNNKFLFKNNNISNSNIINDGLFLSKLPSNEILNYCLIFNISINHFLYIFSSILLSILILNYLFLKFSNY